MDQRVERPIQPRRIHRRTVLGGFAIGAVGVLLAACGGNAPATTASDAGEATTASGASTVPTPAGGGESAATAAARVTTPGTNASPSVSGAIPAAALASPSATRRTAAARGELRLALGFDFPAKIDALKDTHMLPYGLLETLIRQTPQNTLEPWLAERVAGVDPTTWRVTLRQGAKFWDGSVVTAADVIAAFKKNWDAFPDGKGIISPDTQMTAIDPRTVEFKTPAPSGIFPYALSLTNFAIHKPSTAGGADGGITTGPYRPTKFTVDNELIVEPFADHWGGTPPIARISIRYVPDPNARILALQSGDVDMLYNFPPESIKGFDGDIVATATPSGRVDLINLNLNRPPFSDRAVREAMSIAIDRATLNTVGLDGRGTPLNTLFPTGVGYETVPLQGTDVARAKQLLDEAGWAIGGDGIRAKGGQRLAFTLLSYPGRAQLTPYAVSIQSQLKPIGFDVQVKEVQNVTDVTKTGDWDATMKSNNMLPTGDPLYELNRLLGKGGGDNVGLYTSPQIEALLTQLRVELDPARRQALSRQIQEIAKADVPDLFLAVGPITTAYKRGKVLGYTPHPNDSYLITTDLTVG